MISDAQIRTLALAAGCRTRVDWAHVVETCLVALGEHPTERSPEAIAAARERCAAIIEVACLSPGA